MGAALLCLFPAATSLGSDDSLIPLKTARVALARGDGIAADVTLQQALNRGVSRDTVAAAMGEAKLLQGNLAQARDWLQPERFAPGERAYGFRMLGQLEMREGNLPGAGQAFDQALKLTPDSSALWVDIGQLRYRGGEQLQAIAAVQNAVRLDPGNAAALTFQGQLVRDSTGFVSALPWFARAHALAPQNPEILFHYAATLGELGRAGDMLAATRQMIEADPRNPQAFYLQAVLAARAGRVNLGRRLLVRAGEPLRDVPSAMLLNGILEFQAGNFATSIELFERLWQRQPDNRAVPLLLARALYQAGHMRELTTRFAPLAQQESASPYLLTLVGRAYEAQDDRVKAAAFLDRAAAARAPSRLLVIPGPLPVAVLESRWREDRSQADALIPMVRQLIANGSPGEAVAAADQMVSRYPGSADIRMLAGDANMAAGAYGRALDHYSLAADVRCPPIMLERMAAALVLSGQADKADILVRNYLREHPMDGNVAAMAADFAARKGQVGEARRFYKRAFLLGEAAYDPDSLSTYAMLTLRGGDPKLARSYALKAYRMQRANGRSALVAGKVLRQSDGANSAVARALLAKAAHYAIGN